MTSEPTPLSDEDLAAIQQRAAEAAAFNAEWPVDELAGEDVPRLVAEVKRYQQMVRRSLDSTNYEDRLYLVDVEMDHAREVRALKAELEELREAAKDVIAGAVPLIAGTPDGGTPAVKSVTLRRLHEALA